MATLSIFDIDVANDAIVNRIKQVDGVRAVRGVNNISQIQRGQTTGIHGFVFLILDEYGALDSANNGKNQLREVTYTAVVAIQRYNNDGMPIGTGKLVGGVDQALSGFSPLDDDPRSRQILKLTGKQRSIHDYGLSLYPLKYTLELNFKSNRSNP